MVFYHSIRYLTISISGISGSIDSAVATEAEKKTSTTSARAAFSKKKSNHGRKMGSGAYYNQMLAIERAKLSVKKELLEVKKSYYAEKLSLIRSTQRPLQTLEFNENGQIFEHLN